MALLGVGFVLGLRCAPDGDHVAAASTTLALGIRIPEEFELITESADILVAKGSKRRGMSLS
ncbi:MAG: hypothetical protein IPM58_03175 [Nitrospira sp.]|nr:hypothetical protein [Nitrospira sp.]